MDKQLKELRSEYFSITPETPRKASLRKQIDNILCAKQTNRELMREQVISNVTYIESKIKRLRNQWQLLKWEMDLVVNKGADKEEIIKRAKVVNGKAMQILDYEEILKGQRKLLNFMD